MSAGNERDADYKRRVSIWWVLAPIAVLVTAVVGGCAYVLSTLNLDFDVAMNATPGIYKPIPISPAACPYLRRVRNTAKRSGDQWWASFENRSDVSLNEVRVDLARFASALGAALPHVPQPVTKQLFATLLQVQVGEREAARATTLSEYNGNTFVAITEGERALGNASDMVGDACGFRVRPFLNFGTSTSTTAP